MFQKQTIHSAIAHFLASHTVAQWAATLRAESRCLKLGVRSFLAHGNSLGVSGRQTLAAITRNGSVDHGAAIHAFPCIEHKKEIREPL